MQEGIEQGHQGTMSRKHLARDQKREGVMQDPQGGAGGQRIGRRRDEPGGTAGCYHSRAGSGGFWPGYWMYTKEDGNVVDLMSLFEDCYTV